MSELATRVRFRIGGGLVVKGYDQVETLKSKHPVQL